MNDTAHEYIYAELDENGIITNTFVMSEVVVFKNSVYLGEVEAGIEDSIFEHMDELMKHDVNVEELTSLMNKKNKE